MPLLPFACRDVLRDGRGAGLRQPAENVGRRHGALGRSFRLRKRWTLLHDGYDRLGRGIGVRLLCIVRSGCMGVRRSPVPQVPGPFRRRSFLGSGGRALRGPLLYDIQLSGTRARRAAFVFGCQRPAGGTVRGALHALVRSGLRRSTATFSSTTIRSIRPTSISARTETATGTPSARTGS